MRRASSNSESQARYMAKVLLACLAGAAGGCSQPVSGGGGGSYYILPDSESGGDAAASADHGTPESDATDPSDAPQPDDSTQDDSTVASDVVDDAYDGPACTTSSACKDYQNKHLCATALKQCVECLTEYQCQPGQVCEGFACKDPSCVPGSTSCDGTFLVTCNADGKTSTTSKCPEETPICVNGSCRLCEPGQKYCAAAPAGGKSKAVMQCNADGSFAVVSEACPGDATCINKQCMVCAPGTKLCDGSLAMACSDDGSGMALAEDCGAKGQNCLGGLCVNPCQGDIKSNTYVGCDFWAVDLDNAVDTDINGNVYDAQNKQYAVVVSNTADAPAAVTVSLGTKGTAAYKTKTYTVAAKALQVINLPDKSWGVPNQNQDGTNINTMVYRILADQPIVAYQFNPLENFGVFSNDASLLLPTGSLGTSYYVMTRRQLADKFRSYITVIATSSGDTNVGVKVTCKTLAGPGVPALKKGDTATYVLKQGQVLNLESNEAGGDLTGSYVESDKPVAVFGGSEASNSPDTGNCVTNNQGFGGKACAGSNGTQFCSADSQCGPSCCADHLEEQMFPVNTLGTTYVASRLAPRGKEKDSYRILAVQAGTTVTTTPSLGVTIPVLGQGAWFEILSDKDFVINANKPVLVAQYMASSFATVTSDGGTCSTSAQCKTKYAYMGDCANGYCEPIGDPSLILAAAVDQFLDDYIFLVPDKYAINYLNIVMPVGATAKVDNALVAANKFTTIAGTQWQVVRLEIPAGPHRLQLSGKGSLTVYGYDNDVSYGYIGGAGLAVLGSP